MADHALEQKRTEVTDFIRTHFEGDVGEKMIEYWSKASEPEVLRAHRALSEAEKAIVAAQPAIDELLGRSPDHSVVKH